MIKSTVKRETWKIWGFDHKKLLIYFKAIWWKTFKFTLYKCKPYVLLHTLKTKLSEKIPGWDNYWDIFIEHQQQQKIS